MVLDILKDINKYIHGIGLLPAVRIEQSKKGINLFSSTAENQLIINGSSELKFSNDECIFGLGQLGQLQSILECPEYAENAKITLGKDKSGALGNIDFVNANGDFSNSYRLMNQQFLELLMKRSEFLGGIKWGLSLTPALNSIKRFNLQAAANSEETAFTMRVVNNTLEVNFGSPATHSGRFVFADKVSGKANIDLTFPVAVFQKILNLSSHAESAEIKLSSQGLMCIELNSGLIVYQYLIPALTK